MNYIKMMAELSRLIFIFYKNFIIEAAFAKKRRNSLVCVEEGNGEEAATFSQRQRG
jgi:hypothetical protein